MIAYATMAGQRRWINFSLHGNTHIQAPRSSQNESVTSNMIPPAFYNRACRTCPHGQRHWSHFSWILALWELPYLMYWFVESHVLWIKLCNRYSEGRKRALFNRGWSKHLIVDLKPGNQHSQASMNQQPDTVPNRYHNTPAIHIKACITCLYERWICTF